jgi:hypothetical protein
MAHTLNIIYGSTTLSLASGDYSLISYPIATPDPGALSVEETLEILIKASSLATWQTDVRAINKAMEAARKYQEGKSYVQVFIQFQGSGEAAAWQSELYDGRLILPESTPAVDWANFSMDAKLIWSRSPFWEAVLWTSLSLTNLNGTDVTSGLRVFNNTDGTGSSPNKKCNYATIDAAEISGDLPAPVKLRLTMDGFSLANLKVGCEANDSGLGLHSPYVDMESGTFFGPEASSVALAGQNNGNYLQIAPGAPLPWQTSVDFYIDFSTYSGEFFRFVVKKSAAISEWPNGLEIKTTIGNGFGENIVILQPDNFDDHIVLGDFRIPPDRKSYPLSSDLADYNINLTFTFPVSDTASMDMLQWLPLNSFVELAGGNVAYNLYRVIYQSGLESQVYKEKIATSDDRSSEFTSVRGPGLFLQPGVDNRLNFIFDPIFLYTDYISVEAWYRPRRLTI